MADQVSSSPASTDTHSARSVFNTLGVTLENFQSNALSILSLSEQCQKLQSSFAMAEASMASRGKELELKEREIVEIERNVENLLKDMMLRQEKLVSGEKKVSERVKKVELREQSVRECCEVIELQKKETSERWRNLKVKERVSDGCGGCRLLMERERRMFARRRREEERWNEYCEELEMREREIDERCRMEELREKEVKEELELREREMRELGKVLELREEEIVEGNRVLKGRVKEMVERLRGLEEREKEIDERCKVQEFREKEISEAMELREREMKERGKVLGLREKEIVEGNRVLEVREREIGLRCRVLEKREKEIDERCKVRESREEEISEATDLREREMKERRKALELREVEIVMGCRGLKERELEIGARLRGLEEREKATEEWLQRLEEREKEVEERCIEQELRGKELSEQGKALNLREKQLHELCGKLELKEEEVQKGFQACCKELESKREQLMEGRRALGLKERELNEKCKEVESKQERLKEQLKALELIEKEISASLKGLELKEKETNDSFKVLDLEEMQIHEKRVGELLKEQHLKVKQIKDCCNLLQLKEERTSETSMAAKELREIQMNQNCKVTELKEKQGIGDSQSETLQVTSAVTSSVSIDIQLLCKNMDAKGVRLYLIEHVKECDVWHEKMLNSLRLASDPAFLVLEVTQSFHQLGFDSIPGDDCTAVCIYLLVQLVKLQPDIRPCVKKQAKDFAAIWRGSLDKQGSHPSEIYCFLQFLASYKLAGSFDSDELNSLFETFYDANDVYWPDQNPHLCRELGLMNKIPGLIQSLIMRYKHLQAVTCICAFKMEDAFPLEFLLEVHLEYIQRRGEAIVKEANSTAQDDATNMELRDLKAVLKCISDFKLESKYSPAPLKLRITQLEKAIEERKTAAQPLTVTKSDPQLDKKAVEHHFALAETTTTTDIVSDPQAEAHDSKKRRAASATSQEQQKQRRADASGSSVPHSPNSQNVRPPPMMPYGYHVWPHGVLPATNWPGHRFAAPRAVYGVPNYGAGIYSVGAHTPIHQVRAQAQSQRAARSSDSITINVNAFART